MMRVFWRETRSVLTRITAVNTPKNTSTSAPSNSSVLMMPAAFRHGVNFEKAVLRGKGANVEQAFGKHGEAVGVAKHNAQLAEITHESAVCAQKYGIEPVRLQSGRRRIA